MASWGFITDGPSYGAVGSGDRSGLTVSSAVKKCWEQMRMNMRVYVRLAVPIDPADPYKKEYQIITKKAWKLCLCREDDPGGSEPDFTQPPLPPGRKSFMSVYNGEKSMEPKPICEPCKEPREDDCVCPSPMAGPPYVYPDPKEKLDPFKDYPRDKNGNDDDAAYFKEIEKEWNDTLEKGSEMLPDCKDNKPKPDYPAPK